MSTGYSERSEEGGFSTEVIGAERLAGQKVQGEGRGRKNVLGRENGVNDRQNIPGIECCQASGAGVQQVEGYRGSPGEAGGRPRSLCFLPCLCRRCFLSVPFFQPHMLVVQTWAPGTHLPLLGKASRARDWLGPAWSQGQRCGRGWGAQPALGGGWGVLSCLACPCAGSHCRVAVGRDGPSSRPPHVLTPGGVLGQVSWTLREAPLTPSNPVEVEMGLWALS